MSWHNIVKHSFSWIPLKCYLFSLFGQSCNLWTENSVINLLKRALIRWKWHLLHTAFDMKSSCLTNNSKGLLLHTFVFDAPYLWNFLVNPCVYGSLGHDFSVGSTGYMVLTMIKKYELTGQLLQKVLLVFLYFTTAVLLQWKCSIWDFVVVWFVLWNDTE